MALKAIDVVMRTGGIPISIPKEMTGAWLDQLVKVWIEISGYNGLDGSGTVALFRAHHGRAWTIEVLKRIVNEIEQPSLEITLQKARGELRPLFASLLVRHQESPDDAEWGFPRSIGQLPR